MTNPFDGRLTSLQTFTGQLIGNEIFEIVSPPTAAAGVNYQVPIATFTAAIGTLPPGGLAGQVLENLGGGVNFSTAWTGLASLIGATTGISIAGSTSLVVGFSAPGGTIGQVLENLGGAGISAISWTGLSALITGSTGIAVSGVTALGVQLASTVGLSVLGVGANATAVPTPIVGVADQILIVNHAGTGLAFGAATPGALPSSLIREPAGTTSIQLATTDIMVGLDSSVGTVTVTLPVCASWVAANPFTVIGLLVRDIIGSASLTTGFFFTTTAPDTFRNGGVQPRVRNPYGLFRFYPNNAKTAWDVG